MTTTRKVQTTSEPEPHVVPGVPFHIEGRRWFQKSYGNTYHTAAIYQGGVRLVKLGPAYGYGEGYLQTAFAWLKTHGLPEVCAPTANGGVTHYGAQYLREVLHSSHAVTDVSREKDL